MNACIFLAYQFRIEKYFWSPESFCAELVYVHGQRFDVGGGEGHVPVLRFHLVAGTLRCAHLRLSLLSEDLLRRNSIFLLLYVQPLVRLMYGDDAQLSEVAIADSQ